MASSIFALHDLIDINKFRNTKSCEQGYARCCGIPVARSGVLGPSDG